MENIIMVLLAIAIVVTVALVGIIWLRTRTAPCIEPTIGDLRYNDLTGVMEVCDERDGWVPIIETQVEIPEPVTSRVFPHGYWRNPERLYEQRRYRYDAVMGRHYVEVNGQWIEYDRRAV